MARNAWAIDTKSHAEYGMLAFLSLEAICLVRWTMLAP